MSLQTDAMTIRPSISLLPSFIFEIPITSRRKARGRNNTCNATSPSRPRRLAPGLPPAWGL